MSTYVLVLIFTTWYGSSMTTIDFDSLTLCEQAGYKFLDTYTGLFTSGKYMCLERK